MRRFENVSEVNAWGFAVLDPHEKFAGPDPRWPDFMIDAARAQGLETDASGRLVLPENFAELEAQVTDQIKATGSSRGKTDETPMRDHNSTR